MATSEKDTLSEDVELIEVDASMLTSHHLVAVPSFDELMDTQEIVPFDPWTTIAKDAKASLVNVPMVVLSWEFKESNAYGTITIMYARTKDGRLVRVIDSGSGIGSQLRDYEESNGKRPFLCSGLVASQYESQDEKGKTIKATTYYIAEG